MRTGDRPRWLVLGTLALVALNLRIALSSVPTVTEQIQAATGWNDAGIGLLTTLPVLCMGAFALVVPRLAGRIGRSRTVGLALALLVVALAARLAGEIGVVLAASAFVAGVGIALAAGLVPGIVREQVPDAVGVATGVWSATMMLGAALGAALTVPLAHALGSWTEALAVWAVPAAVALVAWTLVERGRDRTPPAVVHLRDLPWRSGVAWSLTAYLALNSIVFYTALAWLAPSYVDRGWTSADAGLLMGLFTASQVVAALALPPLAERIRHRRTLFVAMIALATASLVLIGVAPGAGTVVAVTTLGLGLGAVFTMGLALLSEFSADAAGSARLTAMAFFVTYLAACVGPLVAGVLLDALDSWPLVYLLLAGLTLAQVATVPALRRGSRVA